MYKLNVISLIILTTYTGATYASTPDLPQQGLPQQDKVVSGNVTFTTTADKMTINQTSPTTQIDWHSFDIGKIKKWNFNNPAQALWHITV